MTILASDCMHSLIRCILSNTTQKVAGFDIAGSRPRASDDVHLTAESKAESSKAFLQKLEHRSDVATSCKVEVLH